MSSSAGPPYALTGKRPGGGSQGPPTHFARSGHAFPPKDKLRVIRSDI